MLGRGPVVLVLEDVECHLGVARQRGVHHHLGQLRLGVSAAFGLGQLREGVELLQTPQLDGQQVSLQGQTVAFEA